ncbi:MAG: hypothetical protein R2688_04770 [Fimbriimonadaceae bacterium]
MLAKDLANSLIKQSERFSPELALEQTAETLTKDDDGYIITTSAGEQLPTRTQLSPRGTGPFPYKGRRGARRGFRR